MTRDPAPDPRRVVLRWLGPVGQAMRSTTRLLDVEGAFRSGKTTLGLWKVLQACLTHPGMHWLIARWTEDATYGILRPAWRQVLQQAGVATTWAPHEQADDFPNGSRVYLRGLKSADENSRYGKFRGLTLAGLYVDQAEELPKDIYLELIGRLSQSGQPHQAIFTPNPPDENHWLQTEFPETNHLRGHEYIRLSIYDNAHNLPPETIAALEETYPVGHSKHGPAILGTRGIAVRGRPVYGDVFNAALHVGACENNPLLPLVETWDFGKHHPCVLWTQWDVDGRWAWLGGILGRDLFLEDLIPLVEQTRTEWFPQMARLDWACDPAGTHDSSHGVRLNALEVLKQHGITPRWVENSNHPDVRRGAVERIAGYLRRRTESGREAFVIHPTRWRVHTGAGLMREQPFAIQAFEAGYVWDEHTRTTAGGKSIAVPLKDGWFEHVMNCGEYAELNYGRGHQTAEDVAKQQRKADRAALRRAQRDDTEPFTWRRPVASRGGWG